ncbi:MAG: hypothetical protein J7K33_05695 [Candidatus Marinimicrobia bacterium]|nr:hypothetical protein [Candidatus Neomarinimicrobiota bacterium]
MSKRLVLFIMTIVSGSVAFMEIRTDLLFGLFLGIVPLIFLFGIMDSIVEEKLATAHLMVGAFIFSIFAFFRILEFASSYLGMVLGEAPREITIFDILLIVAGVLSFLIFLKEVKEFKIT